VRYLYVGCVAASVDESTFRRAADKYAEVYNVALLKALQR
jgi:hypothetical protein